jgi:regulator of replication initiation timing
MTGLLYVIEQLGNTLRQLAAENERLLAENAELRARVEAKDARS